MPHIWNISNYGFQEALLKLYIKLGWRFIQLVVCWASYLKVLSQLAHTEENSNNCKSRHLSGTCADHYNNKKVGLWFPDLLLPYSLYVGCLDKSCWFDVGNRNLYMFNKYSCWGVLFFVTSWLCHALQCSLSDDFSYSHCNLVCKLQWIVKYKALIRNLFGPIFS